MDLTQSDPFRITLPPSARVVDGQVVADLSGGFGSGSAQDVYESLTASAVFPEGSNTLLCDATSGELTVTLPVGGTELLGVRRSVIKTDNSVNAVILAAAPGNTIEGASAVGAATRYSRLDVVWAADGQWRRAGSVMSPANYLRSFNNLADVASAKLSRQNLGANEQLLTGTVSALPGAVARIPWPYPVSAGNAFLIRLDAVLNGTTDDTVTLTTQVSGLPAQPDLDLPAGAAGDRASIDFAGDNGIPADSVIEIAVSGPNALATTVSFTLKCIV